MHFALTENLTSRTLFITKSKKENKNKNFFKGNIRVHLIIEVLCISLICNHTRLVKMIYFVSTFCQATVYRDELTDSIDVEMLYVRYFDCE